MHRFFNSFLKYLYGALKIRFRLRLRLNQRIDILKLLIDSLSTVNKTLSRHGFRSHQSHLNSLVKTDFKNAYMCGGWEASLRPKRDSKVGLDRAKP